MTVLMNCIIYYHDVMFQGSYVKHIQNETGARVTIRGIGSGYIEAATGKEAEEPMHLVVT
jgi:hypothetical protein